MLFGEFGQRNFKIWYMIPVKKTKFLKNFGPQNASICKFCLENANSRQV